MDPGSGEERALSRRALLTATGVAGVAWVVPSVLATPSAAAASNLASVVSGTAVHVQGNAATFRTQDMPVGTFTRLVLVVAIVADNTGSTGPTVAQPISVSTPGWTLLSQLTDGDPPGLAVFSANPGAAPPAVAAQNLQNGRLTAVVLGWTIGTTVTLSTITGAVAPNTSLTAPAASAPSPATWVFAGSASDGVAANNWAPLPGGSWSGVVPDLNGNNDTPPDIYVARRTSLLTSIPALSETFFQGGSAGANFGAKGVLIGVS